MFGTKLGRFSRVLVTSSCVPLISTSYSPIFMRKAKPLFLSTGFFSISFLFANFFPLLFGQGCFLQIFFVGILGFPLSQRFSMRCFLIRLLANCFCLVGFYFEIDIFLKPNMVSHIEL